MEHSLGLQDIHYENMKSGMKIYKGRLNDEKRQEIQIKDKIKILKDPLRKEFFYVEVVDKLYFDSFKDMVNSLDLNKLGFKDKSGKEVIEVYRSFYDEEKENKYGVVVLEVSLI